MSGEYQSEAPKSDPPGPPPGVEGVYGEVEDPPAGVEPPGVIGE